MCLNAGAMKRQDAESETLIAATLGASYGRLQGCSGQDLGHGHSHLVAFDTTQITSAANRSNPQPGDPCHPLAAGDHPPTVAFSCKDHGADAGEIAPTLRSMGHTGSHANAGGQVAVAFHENQRAELTLNDTAGALKLSGGKPGQGYPATLQGMAVRRLTPVECERLQGFPDNYTAIPYRGKPAADGPRYKALGNSMAVPCMFWIGQRIQAVEGLRNG